MSLFLRKEGSSGLSLRDKIIRGGAYYSIRQLIGTVIAIGGVTCLTRMLGPHDYGVFSAGLGVFIYLQSILKLGIGTYLMRQEGDIDDREYNQALMIVLTIGIVGVALAILCIQSIATKY